MKIAFVCQPIDGCIPPPRNSIGIIIHEFAQVLADHAEVFVYCAAPGTGSRTIREDGVTYRHLPSLFDRKARGLMWRLKRGNHQRPYYASRLAHPAYTYRIAQEVRRQKIDIVHIINFTQFIPLIRKLNPGVRIVLHMECEWLNQLDKEWIHPRLRKTDLILGCSDFITRKIKDRFPDLGDRCRTLPNGVDTERFLAKDAPDSSESRKKVIFVGRASPEKGVHVLIEAFARVVEQVPEAFLEIIGNVSNVPKEYVVDVSDDPLVRELARFYNVDRGGNYADFLKEAVTAHGLDDHVSFVGKVPNDQLQDRLRTAQLLTFPSVWEEPFGIPPLEGMAMGLPVVVTRSGGMAETVVHGQTGLVVDRNDPESLAAAIVRLLNDPPLREQFGKAGRSRAESAYTYRDLGRQLHGNYTELLKTESPATR